MSILGNYVVFFISMMGMTLADNNEYEQFYQEMLEVHNEYRENHSAQPLILDKALSDDAMKIAKAEAEELLPNHKTTNGYNTFYLKSSAQLSARYVVSSWYEDGLNYSNNDDILMRYFTSAFTQVVWQSTKKLGVAVYPINEIVIIVATYSPCGNIYGEYMNNVVTIANPEDDSSSS